jgi:hypothetical protein
MTQGRLMTRSVTAFTLFAALALALLPAGAQARTQRNCGWVHTVQRSDYDGSRTPYKVHVWSKRHGPRCRYARRLIRAAFSGRIRQHDTGIHATSYDIYGPYHCWGNMGYYSCWRPPSARARLVAHYWLKSDGHWYGYTG